MDSSHSNDVPQTEEEPMDTIFDMFDLDPPHQPTPERGNSPTRWWSTKKEKILTALLRSKRLGGGMLWEPYPSDYNGLFSLLLVQRFRCQKGRSLSVLYEQYETSYLFYVTLSFLCNIICYLISVFAFSLVTFSRATTLSKAEKSSLPYYLPIAGGRIIGFIPFLRVLVETI